MTEPARLAALEDHGAFVRRHVGPRLHETPALLEPTGLACLSDLVDAALPAAIRDATLPLEPALREEKTLQRLREFASRNSVVRSLIGLGYTANLTPPVVQRNVVENPAWYTAYTPYQPEISQGRLEALLVFQQMVADLTGMELANASLLDEGTAAAEAMTMAHRIARGGDVFVVDPDTHPQTIAVVRTRAVPLDITVVHVDPRNDELPEGTFGVLVSHPGSSGRVASIRPAVDRARAAGAVVVATTDLLACTVMTPPGEEGADIVVGSAQRFGVPMFFGGPHAGFLATSDQHKRSLPGRIVGVSVDTMGRPATRLALQTREQHIRREKATSNICTSQVLLAIVAGLYAAWHGPEGLTRIATRVARSASALAAGLRAHGIEVVGEHWFDTLRLRVPGRADQLLAVALSAGFNLRRVDDDHLGVTLDELTDRIEVAALLTALTGTATTVDDVDALDESAPPALPSDLQRTSAFLESRTFHAHRSETDMLRWLRELADKDVALDRSMIPLGSCTMKLNSTTSMASVTWPEFADLHPFAPLDQAAGTLELIAELEQMLVHITGYDAVSLQPNAGSQGEYAGLLAIHGYHMANGQPERDICLIPSSAHGTNAASAVLAGMRVVVVACDDQGNIDLDDLTAKCGEHADDLAALMVTYPSTHGVFEQAITQICDQVHSHGGQVYLDGANLNALVGLSRPGTFGADVSHLNLHKTFTIPHGGGGPGVGPIGVRAHLAPFLPNHPLVESAGPATGPGPVSAAPWGSAGILQIPWAYITMMGPDGLRHATEVAIASANHLAARLAPHFPVLYAGPGGLVAHECIIDLRPIQKATGITNEDVAKRLIDYGFHAPTMSFPVPGTLMIEPTESEPLAELDRFVDAMVSIRDEIRNVEVGVWPREDNPLVNAPHPAEDLLVKDWAHPYSRDAAAYPVPGLRRRKYWPPVSRIDNAAGDRHLVCDCGPIEAYAADLDHPANG